METNWKISLQKNKKYLQSLLENLNRLELKKNIMDNDLAPSYDDVRGSFMIDIRQVKSNSW